MLDYLRPPREPSRAVCRPGKEGGLWQEETNHNSARVEFIDKISEANCALGWNIVDQLL